MKLYNVLDLKSDQRKIIVATSYVSPLSNIIEVENELKKSYYKGEILFDLLLSNGFAQNRFLKAVFDGEKISLNTLEISPKLCGSILDEIYTYFYENPKFINQSSLSEPQKQIILKKVLIGEMPVNL
ncbi:type II toxin-antitoxin system RnlB family antitoxin [Alkalihalobacillus sp. FSL W8-0930]